MNTRFLITLACAAGLAAAVPATANARNDDVARNMILGGVAGAIIGDHNNHAAEGAAIGAFAGLLVSAIDTDHCDRPAIHHATPPCRPAHRVVVVTPPPRPHHTTVVVRPPAHHGRGAVVVVPGHDRRHDRRDARCDNRHDRRDDRRDRRDDRRDNRYACR